MNWAFLWVGLGGALGSMARYGISQAWPTVPGRWPVATLTANLLGCLMIGVLWGLQQKIEWMTPDVRAFLIVGILGGFTTFSAFSVESMQMWREGNALWALAYVAVSVGAGLMLTLLGAKAAQWLG